MYMLSELMVLYNGVDSLVDIIIWVWEISLFYVDFMFKNVIGLIVGLKMMWWVVDSVVILKDVNGIDIYVIVDIVVKVISVNGDIVVMMVDM